MRDRITGFFRPHPPQYIPEPSWVEDIRDSLALLHRKVNKIMAVDTQVVAQLVAGAKAVAEQSIKVAAERDAYKVAAEQNGADLAAVQATLAQERADEAVEDQSDAASTQVIKEAADAVLALVNGPTTPDVAPVPIEDVPAVVAGDTPVEAPGGGEVVEPTESTPSDTV